MASKLPCGVLNVRSTRTSIDSWMQVREECAVLLSVQAAIRAVVCTGSSYNSKGLTVGSGVRARSKLTS